MNVGTPTAVAPVSADKPSNVTSPERPIAVVPSNVLTDDQAAEVRQALRDGQLGDYGFECPVMPESEILRRYNDRPDSTAFGRRRLAEQRAKQVA